MKDPKARNFIIREIQKVGVGGIIRRKNILALALNRGIPEGRINKAIYDLIEEEVIVIASAGMYAVRIVQKELISKRIELPTESALSVQVGGTHYNSMKIQPVVFITQAKLTFIQGNIIKYVCRAYKKNGIQDIEKCIHFAYLGTELRHYPKINSTWNKYMNHFIQENKLDELQSTIIRAACFGKWNEVVENSLKLKNVMKINNSNV